MPWEQGQVVVELSRTRTADRMAVVSDMDHETIARELWLVMSRVTQWTAMIENIINQLSISPFDENTPGNRQIVNTVEEFPWDLSHYQLPTSKVGYVYLLVSVKRQDKFYVGKTKENIPTRLKRHNSGNGAKETSHPDFMPWAPVAYIAGVNSTKELKGTDSLEKRWQAYNQMSKNAGVLCDFTTIIDNGKRVVDTHNREVQNEEDKIFLQLLLTKRRSG